MSELQIFKNTEFGSVRTIMAEGEPYFVAKDVTEILGYANASKTIADHVGAEDKSNNESLSSLGQRGGWLINALLELNREVEQMVTAIVNNSECGEFILKQLDTRVDVSVLEKEREQLRSQLRQLSGAKNKLINMLDKSNVSEHIKHIFGEEELDEKAVRNFRTTAADSYCLSGIYESGFKRVNSLCKEAGIKYSYEFADNGFTFIFIEKRKLFLHGRMKIRQMAL